MNNHKLTTIFRDLFFLTLIIGILYGCMLGSSPLPVPDGARYAEIPREMVVTGDYLTPHLNGVKYFEKPPLFYWMQAGAIKAFGLDEWVVRAPNALLGFATCLLLYLVGIRLYNRRAGFFAALILATSSLFFAMGQIPTLDMALTAFLSAALFSFLIAAETKSKNGFLFVYGFAALAVMTKGLVGAVLPGLIILLWLTLVHEWRQLKNYRILYGSLIFLLIAMPWHILVQLKNPEFFHFYFIEQHFLRYLTPYASREQPVWFFATVFLGGFFPWIFFLPAAIKLHFPRWWRERWSYKKELFLLIWPVAVFLFYNFSDSKLVPYILPMFPPLALLVGRYLSVAYESNNLRVLRFPLALLCLCCAALIIGVGVFVTMPFFNFTNGALTRMHLYLPAIALIVMGSATYFAYRRYSVKIGIVVLLFTMSMVLISIAPSLGIGNDKSLKPLIKVLSAKLQPGDEVVCYQNYYQDVPYYLQRRVMVADFRNELDFGMRYADTRQWMLSNDNFWQLWNGDKKMFMFADENAYAGIKQHAAAGKLYLVGRYLSTLLFANH